MNDHDKPRFVEAITECASAYGEVLTPERIATYWRLLSSMSIEAVIHAIDAHMLDPDRGRFFPRPADIIAALQNSIDDGRPSADEAWSIAIMAWDENETVIWTDEIASAWGMARPVLELGDKVGARMAFIRAYERIVDEARRSGVKAVWRVSPGRDKNRRRVVIEEAVAAGRLSADSARTLLPPPEEASADDSTLLPGKVTPLPRDNEAENRLARKRLAELRNMILDSERRQHSERQQRIRKRMEDMEKRKQRQLDALAEIQPPKTMQESHE